jgi:hypothetical protein
MEERNDVHQSGKSKKVRWEEYVLEPVNKPTYWNLVPTSTEQRKARGSRNVLIEQPKLKGVEGAYCLVTPGKDHAVMGGTMRNFCEGDNIRVIRPKEPRQARKSANGETDVQRNRVL